MATIKSLRAKEILDSRGNPTIQLAMWLDTGDVVETSVPNGIKHHPTEAQTLQDQDPQHMAGQGVTKAVTIINQTLAPQLVGQDPTDQQTIDQLLIKLDATEQKSQVGANSLIAISQAVMKAGAVVSDRELYQYVYEKYQLTDNVTIPVCLYGLVNGGQYGSDNLDIQEFLVMPASHSDFRVSLEIENALRTELMKVLKEKGANYSTGALGGFTPSLQKNIDVFEFIVEAARKTPYILARDFFFGIDSGGEQLMKKDKYVLRDNSNELSATDLIAYYQTLQKQYHLNYFEDPFGIKDTDAWQRLSSDLGQTARIAGDAITATNPKLVQQAIQNKLCNALIVKPSQIGTLTETLQAVRMAREAGWSIIVSQRTGETNDDFLADLAVGIGADFVKFGPVNRGESVAKYNRLADIYLALEKNIKEGKTMTDSNQPNDQAMPMAPANDQPAAPAAPTDLPTPTAAPEPAAPAAPAEPATPVANTEPAIQEEVSVAPAAPAAPAEPATPAPASETPVAPAPAASNEAPVNTPPVATPMADEMPKPVEPAPAPEQPDAQDTQHAIDSTLEQIGAKPGEAQPAAPAAPAEEPAS